LYFTCANVAVNLRSVLLWDRRGFHWSANGVFSSCD
jgi:hypothetical protein